MYRFIITAIVTCFAVTSFAQSGAPNRQQKKERIRAAKIAHITTSLDLTTEQAEKFWPIYNEYSTKKRALKKQLRQIHHNRKDNIEGASDAELQRDLEKTFKIRQEEVLLDMEYKDKFLKVISLKQLFKLYKAEKEFKRKLEKMVHGRGQRGNGGHRPLPQD